MDSRKQKYVIIGALCLVVICLSIGYAALSASLKINGTADVQGGSWEVKFLDDKKIVDKKGLAVCNIGTISDTSISNMSALLKAPGDACTFKVQAKNTGSLNAGLSNVEHKDSNLVFEGSGDNKEKDEELLKGNVTYEVYYGDTQINSQTNFDNIPILKPNDEETVILRIAFNSNTTKLPKEAVEVTGLDRTFIFGNIDERPTTPEGTPVKCKVPSYVDTSGANEPVLNGDMIPVVYSENCKKWVKQDLNKSYDYANQVWANAVTITSEKREDIKEAPAGTPIEMNDINTMWVWIPRYSYTIKSEDVGVHYFGKASSENENPTQILPGEIDVKFISKSVNETTGSAQYTEETPTNWRTNEAFNFGGATQAGIWVGKFETAGSLKTDVQACTDESCDVSDVTIKPGVASLRNQTVSSLFFMSRSMQLHNASTYGFNENSGDLHMMKNDEWGAVAYLSQSKYGKYGNDDYAGTNKELYINNDTDYITGKSGGNPSAKASETSYAYNNMTNLGDGQGQAGPGASTTGNITGIYDISGGANEYVMGVLEYDAQGVEDNEGKIATSASGFKGLSNVGDERGSYNLPNQKYYNKYKSADPISEKITVAASACDGGICYGQALLETSGWYGDYAYFVYRDNPWFTRSGYYDDATNSGLFFAGHYAGNSHNAFSCRLTFTT